MRLWSVHPRHLDRQGLTACWREALLAQAVLLGKTRGYTRHPQLQRFQDRLDPVATIGTYLSAVADEASERGYTFGRTRISRPTPIVVDELIPVKRGQVELEREHLQAKLTARSPQLPPLPEVVDLHPLFVLVDGGIESWERGASISPSERPTVA